ncbi:Ribose-5-phosphate isomerase B [bioreactor metagenome]|jgi:ribose 5-phosphate isomerase B|uniref:Ribose-5-phosphate isomerase n=2 Tax=root TaxID=1 RepID=A0A562J400_9FIRM|nr:MULTISPECIES: ribose 5-phosphate isomerase B [Sedimentibacter]MEA5094890.1 ribose 5-phosphate isomerase B [Sedimentibacter saalensis]TWH77951.1 ribose-5-phosphate isomerase [Sedimentibacter saalensis]
MKIVLACDHGGFELKEAVREHLTKKGYEVNDIGVYDTNSVDYPDYGKKAAELVAGSDDKGIVICGTGIGISIAANKVHGIRCALCTNEYMARMSRMHNDANMLALGNRVIGQGAALDIVDVWLSTEFEGGRHLNRVKKIMEIENI